MKNKLLITSDWHIRSDTPICRTDNFQEIQIKTLKQISKIATNNNALILIAGDIFHKAKPEKAQELEILLYQIFKENSIYFIAGQHDLLYHKIENFDKGSIGVLSNYDNWYHFQEIQEMDSFCFFRCFDYGTDIIDKDYEKDSVCITHNYTCEKQLPFFIKNGYTAQQLLDEFDYDLFITGDNHHGFIFEKNNRLVINPGCIIRQTADMKKYKPFVILLNDDMTYEKIFLLDNDVNAVDTSHLDIIKARDNRIDAFVEKLNKNIDLSYSFEDNIHTYLKENNINGNIKTKILQAIGENNEK